MKIDGLKTTKLNMFKTKNGSVLHGIRSTDSHYSEFGEVYFSIINHNTINAWKKHQRMTLNLLVPSGEVRFNFIDSRKNSPTYMNRIAITLSKENYVCITVPPNIIFGFKGLSEKENIVTNIASIIHENEECLNIDINKYEFI